MNAESKSQLDVEALHELSRFHLKDLAASSECGCFHCLRIYAPSEIHEWSRSDADDTALTSAVCPHCSVDAVLPGNRVALTRELLEAMHAHWFAVSREPLE